MKPRVNVKNSDFDKKRRKSKDWPQPLPTSSSPLPSSSSTLPIHNSINSSSLAWRLTRFSHHYHQLASAALGQCHFCYCMSSTFDDVAVVVECSYYWLLPRLRLTRFFHHWRSSDYYHCCGVQSLSRLLPFHHRHNNDNNHYFASGGVGRSSLVSCGAVVME